MTEQLDPNKCSMLEAERWIGISRPTLTKWVKDRGAPYIKSPENGGSWVVSVPDLFKWYLEEEKKKAVEAVLDKIPQANVAAELDPNFMTEEEAKRRKAVADALIREIALEKEAGRVVPIADVIPAVERVLAPARERLMNFPARVAARIATKTGGDPNVINDMIRREIDEVLADLAKEPTIIQDEEE